MQPTHIGRYRVLSPLGAGGMDQVFLAEDTDLGRRVAIKVLSPDRADSSDRSRRQTQEARLASAVNHPTIAQIFEIGEADGVAFIVMEFVEGEPLSARLQDGPLEWTAVVDVGTRTDIFSAGIVLYQLVTGRLPFDGASVTETLDRIVHAQPDSIARLNCGVPLELERIIRKALEKEAARRYQTAR
jgi:serine/threonine protein kinase